MGGADGGAGRRRSVPGAVSARLRRAHTAGERAGAVRARRRRGRARGLFAAAAEGEPNVFVLEVRTGDGCDVARREGTGERRPVRFVLSGSLEAVQRQPWPSRARPTRSGSTTAPSSTSRARAPVKLAAASAAFCLACAAAAALLADHIWSVAVLCAALLLVCLALRPGVAGSTSGQRCSPGWAFSSCRRFSRSTAWTCSGAVRRSLSWGRST